MIIVKKICMQKFHKNFSGKFGEIRAKILRTPKICLLLHLCYWVQSRKRTACFV